MSERQSRAFLGVLYPDSESYDCEKVLLRLQDTFEELSYITHDMDVDENGELKKPHIHWVGKRSPCPLSTVANSLGIPANNIEFCKNYKTSLRYLIHADTPDKYQYGTDDVTSNIDYPTAIMLKGQKETMQAKKIYAYIHETKPPTIDALMGWCLKNDLWSECRRNIAAWNMVIRDVQAADRP